MLRRVAQGREVVIDPLSGNSYYQSSHTPTAQPKPLFDTTPIQHKMVPDSRLTLDSNTQSSRERVTSSLAFETNAFSSQPLITNTNRGRSWSQDSVCFSKSDIDSVEYINQIDNKFLCCVLSVKNRDILVLFDQHAVHERIRLEGLISEAKKCTAECSVSKTQMEMLQSRACHGAIKFGDKLDEATSRKLLISLKNCALPFQCAHGRPSIAPLLNISYSNTNTDPYTCDCSKLRTLCNSSIIFN